MLGLAAEKTDRLSELQGKINALYTIGATLEKQKGQLNDTLESIASRRGPLTKALAQGDATAEKRIVDLESEASSIKRRLEGIELHLAANAAAIVPLEADLAKESEIAAERKQQELAEAAFATLLAEYEGLAAAEADTQRRHTRVHELLFDASTVHSKFGGTNVASGVYDKMFFHGQRVNAGWYPSPKVFGNNQALTILPWLPPKR